jgi:gliding motility-associated-like protein
VNGGAFSGTLNYTGQAAGSHPIIVQDANGCQFATTVNVPTSSGPTALGVTTVNATCGLSNGIINIGATTGGTGPYVYSVNGGAFTGTTSYPGFAAGTYTVIVRDANGCTFTTSATVVNTPGPTAQATVTANSTCGASNGSVTIGATTGGTPAYQYSFNGSAFTSTTNYTGLAAGTYTVTVRDVNGCTFTVNPVVANTPGPTALVVNTTNSTCGNSNGVITIGAVTGGTAAYSYSVAGSAFTATTNYTGFAAGTYTVVVRDVNGCTFTTSATVVNSPGPTALVVNTGNSSCGASNGTITLGAVTGGVPPYTYSVNSSPFTGTTAYTGFASGSYTVVVSDANACTFTTTANVNNASGPTALVVNSTAANCGASNGTVTIGTVTGGVAPYTYSYNGGAFSATTNYTGQAAGTYNVSVRDANGCTFTTTVTVANTPGPTALATVTVNSTCGTANGTLTIGAVTGGTAAYTYSINGSAFTGSTNYTGLAAGTYTVTVRDANGCTFTVNPVVTNTPGPTAQATSTVNSTCGASNGTVNIGATTGGTAPYVFSFNGSPFTSTVNYTGLAAGTYTVIVRDANNCTFTVNPIVSNTPGPTAQATTTVNATCGNTNGAVNIGATTGGTPPYTFSFDGGGSTATTSYTGLAAGTHTVIVTDANGCTVTVNPVVGNTPGPTAIVRNTTNSTCGGANGSITLGAVTGGTAPYTYSVNGSPFTTTTSYPGLTANTYPVIVQDANGCQFSTTATINDLSGLTASITAQINVSCNGGSNGSVTVTASGSTPPYSYSFNAGAFVASGTFSSLAAGTYTVTAKDVNGCTLSVPVTITQPSVLTGAIASQTNVNCFGGTTGSVTVSAGGGTTAYTYSIDGGAFGSSATFTGLNAGSHPVVVRDANGCTVNIPVTITQPTALTLVTSSVNATCTAANGSATVVASGGTPAYTYLWTPGGQTTATAGSITAGNYSVLVTDFNGCTQTANVSVGANPGGSATISSTINISCNGANDGSATVSMGGASTPPFTYAWTPSSQTTATASGLGAGTYTVTVNDGNGCIATASTVITEPSVITNTFSNTNVSCNGGTDGTARVIPAGGTPGYTYFWTPGGQTSQTANSLAAGTYTCVITDANGCTKTVTTSITEPPAMALGETHIDANCNLPNGSATVTVAGGVGPYTYSWSTVPVQTTTTASNLAANTYVVTVTDANSCAQTLSVTVNNLSGPSASIFSSNNVSCNGDNDGSATVTVSGGTAPFSYSWAPSGGSLPTASNLVAGTYTLTATDVNGCAASTSVTITEPLLLNTAFTVTNPSCAGVCDGGSNTSTTGGTAPYSYLWTPGGLTTANVTGLCAGNYTLQVTDSMGCVVFKNITLTDPVAITASTSVVNVTCSGLCNGSATANPLTGTGPFTYLWSDINAQTTQTATGLCAGSYTVTVTDANGCSTIAIANITTPSTLGINITSSGNVTCFGACDGYASAAVSGGSAPFNYMWMPGGTAGASVNNLCAGTYTVTVTDANGCTANTTVNIIQPNALIASITHTDATCYNVCDAQATAVYVGGTGPYTFLWTPSLQTTPTATALCDGVQNLIVTDSMGCTANASVVITEPTLLAVSTTTTNSNCGNADGSACAAVIGGSPPFIYSWNDPATQATSCATNLNAGVYTISITDGNGCSVTNVANVNDNLAPIVTIPTSTDVTCGGAANGSAQGNITGGILPYNISWTPGGQTTTFVNGLSGGIYSMVVTDSVGCVGSASVTINEPSALISGITSSFNTSCNLVCDGSATVLAGGGTAPYTYLWNDLAAQTTTTATGLCAQTYSVTTTDANGCTSTSTVTITQPSAVTITLDTLIHVLCNGGNNGQIFVVASGGTPGYTYNWTPAGSGPSVTNLVAGSYQVTVTDLNACAQTATFNVIEPDAMVLTANSNPSTCGNSNGSAGVSVSGGVSPYTYFWSPTALTTAIIPNVAAGSYNVTVTDMNGCIDTVNSIVLNLSGPTVSSITFTEPSCNGLPNGTATAVATGGQPLYTYTWNTTPVQTTQTASALTAGTYQVTVSDQNHCDATGTVVITEPAVMQVIAAPTDTICIGMLSQVYGAGFGGTPPYTYTWNPSSFGTTGGPFAVTPTVTTTYTVSAVDANGCVSSNTTTMVFVHPQIAVTATDTTVCDGSSVVISATATGGTGGPYTYSWSNGVTTSSQTVSPTGATSIDYTVTANDIGCSSAVTDVATVIINPQAISFINAPITAGCEDFTANFTAISNIGTLFDWNFGDGQLGSGSPVTHTYTSSGPYDVTLTVTTALGCVSTISNPGYITVYPAPVAGFTSSPNPATSTSPIVTFTDQSIGASQWDWDFIYTTPANGFFTDTLQNPMFSYPDTGIYIVQQTVTNSYGCTDIAYNSVEIIPEYVIYAPNAFTPNNHDGINDMFMPSGVGIDPDNFEMTIYDRWGNQIFKTTDVTKGWDGTANGGSKVAQIDVYVWKIKTKDYGGQNHSYVGHVTIVK